MITLVLGGARSGKSAYAEALADTAGRPVAYIATAAVGDDPDFAARVAAHRARRPPAWRTIESGPDLPAAVSAAPEPTVLVESLGTWVAQAPDFAVESTALCRSLADRAGHTILVSEEVGLGVHPSTELGGRFRDALGELNQAVAAVADRVVLVVAGCPLELGRPGDIR